MDPGIAFNINNLPPDSVAFVNALTRVGFTQNQNNEIVMRQGITNINELSLLSSSDITDLGKAINDNPTNNVNITVPKLKKLKLITFWFKTNERRGLESDLDTINDAFLRQQNDKFEMANDKNTQKPSTVDKPDKFINFKK
jgi:hypothetical protein